MKTSGPMIAKIRELVASVPGDNSLEDREAEIDRIASKFVEGLGAFAMLFAWTLRANADKAPNFLTFTVEGDDDAYAITIQRCGGMTPTQKISALEDEVRRLRGRLAEAESDVA